MATFCTELQESSLPPDSGNVVRVSNGSWPDAFRVLASTLPSTPSIIVMDKMPWLAEQDDLFDGALQTAWDRLLSMKPVLLLLLGSDLHMMERLTAYDRPFYGRADTMVLGPLNPAETADAVGSSTGWRRRSRCSPWISRCPPSRENRPCTGSPTTTCECIWASSVPPPIIPAGVVQTWHSAWFNDDGPAFAAARWNPSYATR
ncbi:hypothetical protein [Microtetraspora glauca]|uniref:Uncharacterized protein n=1 Tax=Microtetraspora glauca TaxID=1996 RepID=A0ABV3GF26_MICGL